MAFQKITKATYFLFIDPDYDPEGDPDYSLLICLNSFTFNGSTNVTDAASMCGPDQQPGDLSSSIDIDGQYVINPDTTLIDPDVPQVAPASVFTLWQNSTQVAWKIGKAVPEAYDVTKEGTGFFSAYSETHSGGENSTFTATLTVQGDVTQDIESV